MALKAQLEQCEADMQKQEEVILEIAGRIEHLQDAPTHQTPMGPRLSPKIG